MNITALKHAHGESDVNRCLANIMMLQLLTLQKCYYYHLIEYLSLPTC